VAARVHVDLLKRKKTRRVGTFVSKKKLGKRAIELLPIKGYRPLSSKGAKSGCEAGREQIGATKGRARSVTEEGTGNAGKRKRATMRPSEGKEMRGKRL